MTRTANPCTLPRMRRRLVVPLLLLLVAVPVAIGSAAPSGAQDGIALLTDVRAENRGDFDRVTFVFDGGPPDILQAEYLSGPAIFNPQGEPVDPPVGGDARFIITMSGASGVDLSVDPFVVTYTGPQRFSPGLPKVVELVQTQDFEATLSWVIGIGGAEVPVSVQVLINPTRVTLDFPHDEVVVTPPRFTG